MSQYEVSDTVEQQTTTYGGVTDPDPHYFWKLDRNAHKSEKLDPHWS